MGAVKLLYSYEKKKRNIQKTNVASVTFFNIKLTLHKTFSI